jgi:hypothetical protein
MIDVLIVSLGSTGGLRAADDELRDSLRRAGASVELVRPRQSSDVPTLMLTDLRAARAARAVARAGIERHHPQAVIYSSTTAALLWPRAGAIRFDATAAENRPGRHGLWQRPLERLRLRRAPLLLPWSASDATPRSRTLVLPMPVEPSGSACGERDIAAITYGANPLKKGLDRVIAAWRQARRSGEELVVAGVAQPELIRAGLDPLDEGMRLAGPLAPDDYRALLRRARVFVCAPRREDYGIAQLEALADGCRLVTTAAPGPYVALPIARRLDARLVSDDLTTALRLALDESPEDYTRRALRELEPFRRQAADKVVAEQLLGRLLPSEPGHAPAAL